MGDNNYQLLLKKLDEFIRKFYVNQIIRGAIFFFSIAFILFLLAITIEYLGEFNSFVRTIIFYFSASLLFFVFVILIVVPFLKILAIGSRISHEKASEIIGQHFIEIKDKLTNILQLKNISSNSSDLIYASINQKISLLSPLPFNLAINFSENKRYLKYLIVPTLIILGLAAFEPKIITDSSNRLISHSVDFVPSAPYKVEIENKKMVAYKNDDFTLKVQLNGEEIPNSLNIIFSGLRFRMIKQNKNHFSYTFKNIQEDIKFTLFDGEFESIPFLLTTLPKPLLVDFTVNLVYPKYLGMKPASFNNTGDIVAPEGTQIKWTFNTENTKGLAFISQDSTIELIKSGENEFLYSKRVYASGTYGLSPSNEFLQNADTIQYSIEVIPDLSPTIEVDAKDDSTNIKMKYFKGIVKDDYGFSKLLFHTQFVSQNDSLGIPQSEYIPINNSLAQTDFFFAWNTAEFLMKAGDKIEFFFEIWDNDGVNGSKSSRTQKFSFNAPSKEELQEQNEKNSDLVKSELQESLDLTKEIKKELDALNEKLLSKKQLGFQEKKQLESLLDKQKKVQQSLKKIKENNQKNNQLQKEYSPQDETIVEKQKQLENMFENIFSEEMKEMMKQLEDMMKKLQKDQLQKSLEKIELSNEELEKELDRNLELFKQLELEKELGEAKEKLDQLKDEQADLKEQSLEKKSDADEIKDEQDELKKDFDKLSEELNEIEKKNQELERPFKLEETEETKEQIKENMEKSSDELSKNNKKEAAEQQEEAENEMQSLSKKLEGMQMQMQSENNVENLEDLRALLENLIQLSFDQEDVMEEFKKTGKNDPKYVPLTQQQKKLKDDSKIIEDSLFALSKRVIQLESIVNREMTAVNFNMDKAINELGERRTPIAIAKQQRAMTSINNLALLLDEAVQNMQMQMQMKSGKGECKKPGQGKPKPGGMKALQQQLNQKMESLKKAMEKGKSPGGEKKGEKGKKAQGAGGMSKELAQMAAKQAALREAVEQLQEQIGNGEGNAKEAGNLKKLGELMEKTETDLVNKQLTNETLLRQKEILSRLLESEKAEREREKDDKRESREFTDEISRNPNTIFEYNSRKEREIELLKTLPPSFNEFYKTKVSEYFNLIQK